MLRTLGPVLTAIGFLALAAAILIRDPTALDANIGAGILSSVGLVVGTLGLVLTAVGAVISSRGASGMDDR